MSDLHDSNSGISRRGAIKGGLAAAVAATLPGALPALAAQGTGPIRIGSTLALTGPLAATGMSTRSSATSTSSRSTSAAACSAAGGVGLQG